MNFLAILSAAISQMVLGTLWYGPYVFGKPWMKAMGMDKMTDEEINKMKKSAFPAYFVSFFSAIIMALVLSYLLNFLPEKDIMTGIIGGFVAWFGFVMPVGLVNTMFGDKKMPLFLINYGFQLVTLIVMGAIIGAW